MSVKTISVRELQANLCRMLDAAQKKRLVVTRHGKPAALLVGLEGRAIEDVLRELGLD